jgi:iron complex transport system substrate-binding protein
MLNLIQDKVKDIPESERPKVYLELGDTPYQTTGNKGAWHITLEMAGGRDLFGDIDEEYFVADPEEVVKRNPDIFVKKEYPEGGYDSNNLSEMIPERNELLNRTELANVKAIRNGRVFLIDSSVFANPKFVIGIAYMAKWFYPDLFKDIDPQAFHKEYLERFIGIPYRGFYVYPPPS